jgi:hypothetical protein
MTAPEPPRGALTLYISGASALSARAIADATALCEVLQALELPASAAAG